TYHIPGMMPDHIFFDKDCQLARLPRVTQPSECWTFCGCILFQHSTTDTFCQTMCNPAPFPELKGEGNKLWFFNSSITE
ncbi:hypothetical protein K443DRAFT_86719, partial [Laccaria amethystina LaAM-08-1]